MLRTLRFIIISFLLLCSAAAEALPVIDSVAQVSTMCTGSGRLTVYAHGTGPLTYTIISGPVTHAAQSTRNFTSLPSGSYTVEVTDASGATVTATATVASGGSYNPPVIAPYFVYPPCKTSHDFLIVGNLTSTSPARPIQWQLTGLNISTPYQNSDTFHITEPGSYTVSCGDACGNIVSSTISFYQAFTPNIVQPRISEKLKGCDSMIVDLTASVDGDAHNVVFPFTLTLTRRGVSRSFTQTARVLNTPVVRGATVFSANDYSVEMINTMPHTPGDTVYAVMVDGCGDTVRAFVTTPTRDTALTYDYYWRTTVLGSCQVTNANDFRYNQSKPNNWQVINNQTHALIASGTNQPDGSTANTVTLSNLPSNVTYTLISLDGCGDTVIGSFLWPAPGVSPTSFRSAIITSCLDHTGSQMLIYSGYSSGVTVELLSGPSGSSSTTPGFAYSQHYTYPKYFHGREKDTLVIADLGVGIYVYKIYDSCGHSKIDSFNMWDAFTMKFTRSVYYTPGCNNTNVIHAGYGSMFNNFSDYSADVTITNVTTGAVLYRGTNNYDSILATVYNVPPGKYVAVAQLFHRSSQLTVASSGFYSMADSAYCNEVIDTIVIPEYYTPTLKSVTGSVCSGVITIDARVDSATGLAPYRYAIISGPETQAAQASHVFTVGSFGTYTVRVSDACGHDSTLTVTIDSITSGPQHVYRSTDSCFRATVLGQVYTAPAVVITTVQNVTGCDSIVYTDSVFIRGSGDSLPILTHVGDTACTGTPVTLSAAHIYTAYAWGDGTTAPSIVVTQAGAYTLKVTDGEGCLLTDTSRVAFLDSPYVASGWISDAIVCTDDPAYIHLTISDASASYTWDATAPDLHSLDRTVSDSGMYTFTISNRCAATTYTLSAVGKECDENLYVPSAFSPNGDGENDLFQIYTSYKLKQTRIDIYNRWGEKVYEGTDQSTGWDGRYKGDAAPTGIYVYVVNAVWLTGHDFQRRGSITLIR